MSKSKPEDNKKPMISSNDHNQGIKRITHSGANPSLHVEAQIALRQWNAKNGSHVKANSNDKPKKKD
jgi:hypothetical protein